MELQKVIRKVEDDKRKKREKGSGDGRQVGMWGNYCTIQSMNEMEEEYDDDTISESFNDVYTIFEPQTRFSPSSAPLLGPPRKFGKFKKIFIFHISLSSHRKQILKHSEIIKHRFSMLKTTTKIIKVFTLWMK